MDLKEKLDKLPEGTGVYLMLGKDREILYVGKAKSIKKRVKSYFVSPERLSSRIKHMIKRVAEIDFILTESEVEALTLEDNFIKQHQPFYNILLKDDKNYPFLLITDEKFPRLQFRRKVTKGDGEYFGPYISAKALHNLIKLIQKLFKIRESKDNLDGKPLRRVCINYQIDRCYAPCAGKISEDEYRKIVNQVRLFLKDDNISLLRDLEAEMQKASDQLNFELAQILKAKIAALRQISERQSVSAAKDINADIIAAGFQDDRSVLILYRLRDGRLNDERSFHFSNLTYDDIDELLSSFILQFYERGDDIPDEIVTEIMLEDSEKISDLLSLRRGLKVRLKSAQKGRKHNLLMMGKKNAKMKLLISGDDDFDIKNGLSEIRNLLGLKCIPSLIEGYDISNIHGRYSVGVKVAMVDGVFKKDLYRKYNIKSVESIDDYSSLVETVTRRLKSDEDLPDLIIIDGGKGQLSSIGKTLSSLGKIEFGIIAISKGKQRDNPDTDKVYILNSLDEVDFKKGSDGLKLLQKIRDESHRFAISSHRLRRAKSSTESVLDGINGIGEKRKRLLMTKFGSVSNIKKSSADEIAKAIKVSKGKGEEILSKL